MQYLKQKSQKIEMYSRELSTQNQSNSKNNKTQLQEDLVKDKKVKLKWIMDFALNIMQTLTCNRQQIQQIEEASTNRFDVAKVEEAKLKLYEFDPEQKAQDPPTTIGKVCENFDSSNPFEYCSDCSQ